MIFEQGSRIVTEVRLVAPIAALLLCACSTLDTSVASGVDGSGDGANGASTRGEDEDEIFTVDATASDDESSEQVDHSTAETEEHVDEPLPGWFFNIELSMPCEPMDACYRYLHVNSSGESFVSDHEGRQYIDGGLSAADLSQWAELVPVITVERCYDAAPVPARSGGFRVEVGTGGIRDSRIVVTPAWNCLGPYGTNDNGFREAIVGVLTRFHDQFDCPEWVISDPSFGPNIAGPDTPRALCMPPNRLP
jgi:hypothetical protein